MNAVLSVGLPSYTPTNLMITDNGDETVTISKTDLARLIETAQLFASYKPNDRVNHKITNIPGFDS